MKKIILFALLSISLFSCVKPEDEEEKGPYPCLNGNCEGFFYISGPGEDSIDLNGYHHIKYIGLNYFTIRGELSELIPKYVINEVPLIEVGFDSDYFVLFDTVRYRYPVYSFLGLYTDKRFKDPIPVGTRTYTMAGLSDFMSPTNIVGYQIPKKFTGWEKPYARTILAVYSKYTYQPGINIFLDDEMIGDTATIFMRVVFNSDFGRQEIKNYEMKVIFE
jgi:hypothetical protein